MTLGKIPTVAGLALPRLAEASIPLWTRQSRPQYAFDHAYSRAVFQLHAPLQRNSVRRPYLSSPCLFAQGCFIGHSFGSVVVSWMIASAPECVESVLLLDPVSLMLQEPDVAHNFLYREPGLGSPAVQTFFKYFVATELHVRAMLSSSCSPHSQSCNGANWLELIPPAILL